MKNLFFPLLVFLYILLPFSKGFGVESVLEEDQTTLTVRQFIRSVYESDDSTYTQEDLSALIDFCKQDPRHLTFVVKFFLGAYENPYFSVSLSPLFKSKKDRLSFVRAISKSEQTRHLTSKVASLFLQQDVFNFQPNVVFEKFILLNIIYTIYVQDLGMDGNYNKNMNTFLTEFDQIITSFWGEFSQEKLSSSIYSANEVYPFSYHTNIPSNELDWQAPLTAQKFLPVNYSTYLKLKTAVNFDIQDLTYFYPIFAANSLITIYNYQSFIFQRDKRRINDFAHSVLELYRKNSAKMSQDLLSKYLVIASQDILTPKTHNFISNNLMPFLADVGLNFLEAVGIPYTIIDSKPFDLNYDEFFLIACSIRAKSTVLHILKLKKDEIIELKPKTLLVAITNSVLNEYNDILEILLQELQQMMDQDEEYQSSLVSYIVHTHSKAKNEKQYEIAKILRKFFPSILEESSDLGASQDSLNLQKERENLRFNYYRAINSKADCRAKFATEHQF